MVKNGATDIARIESGDTMIPKVFAGDYPVFDYGAPYASGMWRADSVFSAKVFSWDGSSRYFKNGAGTHLYWNGNRWQLDAPFGTSYTDGTIWDKRILFSTSYGNITFVWSKN